MPPAAGRHDGGAGDAMTRAAPQAPIAGIRACVFDAYGTVFDYASAAARCRDELGEAFGRLTQLWRDKQLQYTWLRAVQGKHADFWQVTGDALDFALETLGIEAPGIGTPALRDRLMKLYLTLDAFPEVPDVLRQLRTAGLKTAILSNGSPRMLQAAIEGAGLADSARRRAVGRGGPRVQAPP